MLDLLRDKLTVEGLLDCGFTLYELYNIELKLTTISELKTRLMEGMPEDAVWEHINNKKDIKRCAENNYVVLKAIDILEGDCFMTLDNGLGRICMN